MGFEVWNLEREVVERYISGQKGCVKAGTLPVVVIEKKKEKTHKIGHVTLYAKFFRDKKESSD